MQRKARYWPRLNRGLIWLTSRSTTRWRAFLALASLITVFGVCELAAHVRAQAGPPPWSAPSVAEEAAFAAVEQNEMIRARELGEAVVAEDPTSFIGHLTLAYAQHFPAKLCGDCSFGSKKDECAKCGKWRGSTSIPARLCSDHGFGSKGDNCVRCGKWVGSSKAHAFVCGNCGFGSKKDNCVICGKWAP